MTTKKESDDAMRRITVDVVFHGHEDQVLPNAAVYRLDAAGKPTEKLGEARQGQLELDGSWIQGGDLVGIGPDAAIHDIKKEQLVVIRLSRSYKDLIKLRKLEIPEFRWRLWPLLRVCLHGHVEACWRLPVIWPLPVAGQLVRTSSLSLATGPSVAVEPVATLPSLNICHHVCEGVVEVYEHTCCCYPWVILDRLLERLPEIVGPWPPIPVPDPDPWPPIRPFPPGSDPLPFAVDSITKHRIGQGIPPAPPVPSRLQEDYRTLLTLPREEAVAYVDARPYLWPIGCSCSTRKLGEVGLKADGTFDFCYFALPQPPLPPPLVYRRCRRTYTYKVKQFQETHWVYIYDGIQRNEYFIASEDAELKTFHPLARTCQGHGSDIDHDGDFVALDFVGTTSSSHLVSPKQMAVEGINQLLPDNGGLVFPPPPTATSFASYNRPWATTLALRLKVSRGLKAKGAKFYRLAVAPADANGNPAGPWRPLTDAVSWQYYEHVADKTYIKAEALGPQVAGAEQALFLIPYDDDREWRGLQYHQRWDTTVESSQTSSNQGRTLLRIEIFDAAGDRLRPNGAAGSGNDTAFDYLRVTSETEGTAVPFATLVHAFWVDNRPCVADIKDLRLAGIQNAQCLFLSGAATDNVRVGFAAGHYGGPPGQTFMRWYSLNWRRGLNGPAGTFESGTSNHPDPFSNVSAPSAPVTIGTLLGAHTKCSFALTLNVYPKHWNGSSYVEAYRRSDVASFALEVTS